MSRSQAARQLINAARRGLHSSAPSQAVVTEGASFNVNAKHLLPATANDLGHVRMMSTAAGKGYHQQPIPVEAKGGLHEFSVIYTDRATNSMSKTFQTVMKDLNSTLTTAYNCHKAVLLPGSGTYAMESVARQFCSGKKALVIRLGYFSYRWCDIFEQGGIPSEHEVIQARPVDPNDEQPQFAPPPIEEVVAKIKAYKPAVVFAPHVETSNGIMLPDSYIKAVADAAHEVGAAFVLDGVASGMKWVDMGGLGVDAYLTAPQKGWTAPACAGIVMLSQAGHDLVDATTSTSLCLNVKKWRDVMDTYLNGAFSYHTTMPTDALQLFRDTAQETQEYGFAKAEAGFVDLGKTVRAMLTARGYKSVAAEGFQAPGVVVAYTSDPKIVARMMEQGLQLAAGVPLMLGEAAPPTTRFRVGLFGIDKVYDAKTTVSRLEAAMDAAKL